MKAPAVAGAKIAHARATLHDHRIAAMKAPAVAGAKWVQVVRANRGPMSPQ